MPDEEHMRPEDQPGGRVHESTLILESLRSGFVALDRGWRLTYINTLAAQLFGSQAAALVGQNLWDVLPQIVGTGLETHLRQAATGETVAFEIQPVTGGQWYEINIAPHENGLAVSFLNITPRKRLEESLQAANSELESRVLQRTAELRIIAYQDPLTQIANRRAFEDDFERMNAGGAPYQLLVFDVDNLKQVNDTEGHDRGDLLLSGFAQALQQEFQGQGKAYRLGGDEFAVMLPGQAIHLDDLHRRNDTLRTQIRQQGFHGARASVGLASFPLDTQASNDLIRLADQRMLRDKAARRALKGLNGEDPTLEVTPLSTEMMWQALRAVSSLISQEGVIDQPGWQAFLNAAVAALPGAEAGSLYVREGSVFVMVAQVGFSDALLGVGHSTTSMNDWYGAETDWTQGVARVLRGSDRIQVRSHDTRDEPSLGTDTTIFDDLGDLAHLQTNLAVPVVVSGRVEAILNLDNLRTAQAFQDRELKIAEELARQAAAILATHERQARETARTQELEILAQANAALSLVQTSDDIERVLVAETRALLRTEHVVFVRHEPMTQTLQLRWPSGRFARFPTDIPREQTFAWRAMRDHTVIHIPHLAAEERAYRDVSPMNGSLIAAPLVLSSDVPLGAIVAVRAAPSTFSDLDGRVVGALASAGVAATERVHAAMEERQRTQELQMLAELAQQVGLAENLRTVAEHCLTICRSFLNADFALFACLHRHLVISTGTAPPAFHAATAALVDPTDGPRADVLNRYPYATTHEYPLLTGADPGWVAAGVKALVQVPVLERGRPVGVVLLVWFQTINALPPAAVPLTTRSAELLGQILDREAHITDVEATREGALLALGLALELRDFETAGHTERVVGMALKIGQRLGLEEEELEEVRVGAYLHDIGKLALPDAILLKPGALDEEEWRQMQRHAVIGDELVGQIPTVLAGARQVVRHHHERWDGTGYPDGLAGTTIPLGARIFSLADVYDALTSVRPYKRAWTPEEATRELRAQSGRQFDPAIVDAALAVLGVDEE